MKLSLWLPAGAALGALMIYAMPSMSAQSAVPIPPPAVKAAASAASERIVLAGGCFWGVQGVFQHVRGVTQAVSGYAGGDKANPSYAQVGSGSTGHAESVEIDFDPRVVDLGTLLQVYFSVAHNPTELNYQGPDEGTQYRSEIFTTTPEQAKVAAAYIRQLDEAKLFGAPIVTKVEPLRAFYAAEGYHQNYLTLHPDSGYIAYNDLPKIENLKRMFPAIYREKPQLVALTGE